jgi:hypothetical protein
MYHIALIVCSSQSSFIHLQHHPVLGSQDNFKNQHWLVVDSELNRKVPEHLRHDALHLEHGELLADAVPRTGAKGDVQEWMALRLEFVEPLGHELQRFIPERGIACHEVGANSDVGSSWY